MHLRLAQAPDALWVRVPPIPLEWLEMGSCHASIQFFAAPQCGSSGCPVQRASVSCAGLDP